MCEMWRKTSLVHRKSKMHRADAQGIRLHTNQGIPGFSLYITKGLISTYVGNVNS